MSKAYKDDIGTAIELNTLIDLSGASTMEYKVKKPDGTIVTWDAEIPSALTEEDGYLVYFTESGDFDQSGNYYIQPHVVTATSDHLGDTVTIRVYDAFQ